MPMTDVDWVEFYKSWEYDQLLEEIETCYRFQQDTLQKVGQRLMTGDTGLSLLIQSQRRTTIINEVLRGKVIGDLY